MPLTPAERAILTNLDNQIQLAQAGINQATQNINGLNATIATINNQIQTRTNEIQNLQQDNTEIEYHDFRQTREGWRTRVGYYRETITINNIPASAHYTVHRENILGTGPHKGYEERISNGTLTVFFQPWWGLQYEITVSVFGPRRDYRGNGGTYHQIQNLINQRADLTNQRTARETDRNNHNQQLGVFNTQLQERIRARRAFILERRLDRQDRAFNQLIQAANTEAQIVPQQRLCYISYAWEEGDQNALENRALHRRLKHLTTILQRANYAVFLDILHMDGIPRQQMQQEIGNAYAVILICTPRLLARLANVNSNVAYELQLTHARLVANPNTFQIIPLRFSGTNDTAVPANILNNNNNQLTIDFTRFYAPNINDRNIGEEYASYMAVARVTQLLHRLHFPNAGANQNNHAYHPLYREYQRARSTNPNLNPEVDLDLSDEEAATNNLRAGF